MRGFARVFAGCGTQGNGSERRNEVVSFLLYSFTVVLLGCACERTVGAQNSGGRILDAAGMHVDQGERRRWEEEIPRRWVDDQCDQSSDDERHNHIESPRDEVRLTSRQSNR